MQPPTHTDRCVAAVKIALVLVVVTANVLPINCMAGEYDMVTGVFWKAKKKRGKGDKHVL